MIELFDDYVITVDNNQYALGKRHYYNSKDGARKESTEYFAYFTSLSAALNGFVRYLVRQRLKVGRRTLTEAVATIQQVEKEVTQFIEENIPQDR